MLTLSPTRIRVYQDCPQRYALTYIHRVPTSTPAAGPRLAFGSSLHAALKEYYRRPPAATDAAIRRLLQRTWVRVGYTDFAQEAEYFAEGVTILRQYRDTLPPDVPCQQEVTLSQVVLLAWQPVKLVGRVDRLDHYPDGAKELVDYKTTASGASPTPDRLAADLPTFVYYTLGRLTFQDAPRVTVSQINLRSLDRSVAAYTPDQLAANDDALASLACSIETGPHEARPGGRCAWCPVRPSCPVGAGDERRP